MNKRLSDAIARLSALPEERQQAAAVLLLDFLDRDGSNFDLTSEQLAEIDLESIHSYLAREDARIARRVVERIRQAVDRLEDFPYSGRPGPRGVRLVGAGATLCRDSPRA
jgi:hypothetical protein